MEIYQNINTIIEPNYGMHCIVGHCPRCGNPIYMSSSSYLSILPPVPIRTCSCFSSQYKVIYG